MGSNSSSLRSYTPKGRMTLSGQVLPKRSNLGPPFPPLFLRVRIREGSELPQGGLAKPPLRFSVLLKLHPC